MKTLDSTSIV